jgi:hypothetical protein
MVGGVRNLIAASGLGTGSWLPHSRKPGSMVFSQPEIAFAGQNQYASVTNQDDERPRRRDSDDNDGCNCKE